MTIEDKIFRAEERISFTKTRLILDMPFFGIIMSKLNTKPDFNSPNMGIDGRNLIYSPDFILRESTTDDLLLFIFIHEVFHIVLNHLERRDGRDEDMWDVACDFVVNDHIMQMSNSNMFSEIIRDCLWNISFRGKTAEEIYDILSPEDADRSDRADDQDKDGDGDGGSGDGDSSDTDSNQEQEENDDWENDDDSGSGGGSGLSGGNDDSDDKENENDDNGSGDGDSESDKSDGGNQQNGNPSEKNDENQQQPSQPNKPQRGNQDKMPSSHSDWNDADNSKEAMAEKMISIRHAYEMTKTSGSTPIIVQEVIDQFFDPKEDWRRLLAKFVEPMYPDYTFSPPSDMYPTFDFIMPEEREVEDGVSDIYFYIDSSGSIPHKLLREMASEIKGCYEQFGDKSVIYYGDWAVQASDPKLLEDADDIQFEMSGGTDPTCIFEKLKEIDKLHEARAIIILTDGYFFHTISPEIAEGVDVLWLVVEDGTKEYLTEWENVVDVSKEE